MDKGNAAAAEQAVAVGGRLPHDLGGPRPWLKRGSFMFREHDHGWRLRWNTPRDNQRFQCRRVPCMSQPRC